MSSTTAHPGSHMLAAERSSATYQAYQMLHLAFTVTRFSRESISSFTFCAIGTSISPVLSPIGGHNLMLVVGVIEVAAGVLVAIKPRLGAPVVGAWLCLITPDHLAQEFGQ